MVNTGRYTEFLNLVSTLFWFRILLRNTQKKRVPKPKVDVPQGYRKRSKTPEPKQTRQKVQEFGVPPSVNSIKFVEEISNLHGELLEISSMDDLRDKMGVGGSPRTIYQNLTHSARCFLEGIF